MIVRDLFDNRGFSRALVISLALHGTILVFLGTGAFPNRTANESRVLVYLAAPPKAIQPSSSPGISETLTAQKAAKRHTPPQRESKVRADHPKPDTKLAAETARIIPPSEPRPEKEELQVTPPPEPLILKASYVDTTLETSIKTAEVPGISYDHGPATSTLSSPTPAEEKHQPAPLPFTGETAALGMISGEAQGHGLVPARPLSLPEPVYPVLSRKRGEEGRVVLEVQVSAQGGVLTAQVSKSSSHVRLDRAALEAVKGAVFIPASEADRPVRSKTRVAYRFELEGR